MTNGKGRDEEKNREKKSVAWTTRDTISVHKSKLL